MTKCFNYHASETPAQSNRIPVSRNWSEHLPYLSVMAHSDKDIQITSSNNPSFPKGQNIMLYSHILGLPSTFYQGSHSISRVLFTNRSVSWPDNIILRTYASSSNEPSFYSEPASNHLFTNRRLIEQIKHERHLNNHL